MAQYVPVKQDVQEQAATTPMELEPVQIGRTRLTPKERQCRMTAKECLYCGKKGHFVSSYPVK